MNPAYEAIASSIPQNPGVYRYFDKENTLIYIGKAKNLKKRVSSYFMRTPEATRTRLMVSKIDRIEFTLVDSEMDALLLENNLIKKYQPRYNIRLKDDKTYPFICLKSEPLPRLIVTRNLQKDGSTYFGPYTSLKTMQILLDLIKAAYPLRTCALNLSPQHIAAAKYSACLEYQIGNCLAPCIGKQTAADYHQNISQIAQLLKGNTSSVIKELQTQMQAAAAEYAFERAENLKQKIESLKNYQSKSTIINPELGNLDVFSIASQGDHAVVNYLQINYGAVVRSHNVVIKRQLEETPAELLLYAVIETRTLFQSHANEILLNEEVDAEDTKVKFLVPKIGDKKRLVEISLKNAFFELEQIIKKNTTKTVEERSDYTLKKMQNDLGLPELPKRIDCFDNSNIQGEYAVSAMVCFINAKPAKSQYRHFNIKTVVGPNDFATMEEVVYRRYKRVLDENLPLPNLVVIDGGKGQLSAALKSLEKLDLHDKIPILGIAKNLEELFFPHDPVPLHLDKKSITLRIIQQLRDEAHRFGITHHRNKRSKETLQTQLTNVQGIGDKIAQKLLQKYKSVTTIKTLSHAELTAEIGEKRAEMLRQYFEQN